MFDKFRKKETQEIDLYKLLPKEKYYATTVLDENNILVAKYNNGIYNLTHYALIDNKLKAVAKWNQYDLVCCGKKIYNYILNNEYIFLQSVYSYDKAYQSIYNYKQHKVFLILVHPYMLFFAFHL